MNLNEQGFKLSHYIWDKRHFDVKSAEDLSEYAYFRANSRWRKNCPFVLEWPHLNITDMIKEKIINEYMDFIQEVVEDVTE